MLPAVVAATTMGLGMIALPAHAAVNINFQSEFAKEVTEGKAVDAAQRLADLETKLGGLADLFANVDRYTDQQRRDAVNGLGTLTTGSTYSVYTSPDSRVGVRVTDAPTLRLGAGSKIPTRTVGGQLMLDADNVASGTFGGVTTNYAGSTTSGSISIGDKDSGHFRTLQNVSAGRVTAASTDAINGSQLFAAQQGINKAATDITNLTTKVNQGFNVTGTTGTDNVQLGDTLTINGANGNIKTAVTNNRVAIDIGDVLNVPTAVNVGTGGLGINKDTGINAGNKKVSNVAPGTISATSTDAVNGSQLDATNRNVTNLTNKVDGGFNITARGGTADNVKLGETITYDKDNNMTLTVANNTVTYGLAPNITVTGKVTAGGGLDSGGNKTTNVADGVIAANSKDAVNGGQIHTLAQQIANGATWNVTDGTNRDQMGAGQTFTYSTDRNMKAVVSDNRVTHSLADSIVLPGSVTATGGFTVPATNAEAGNAVSLTNTGLNNGGNKATNIGDGVIAANSKDAVNGGQIHNLRQEFANASVSWTNTDGTNRDVVRSGETFTYAAGSNLTATVADNRVTYGLTPNVTVTGKVTAGGGLDSGGNKVTNVGDGVIGPNSKDAVNGGQIHNLAQNVTNNTNKIAEGLTFTDGTNRDKVGLGEVVTFASDNNVKLTVSDNRIAATLADSVAVKNNLSAGDTISVGTIRFNRTTGSHMGDMKVTGVAAGDVTATSTDAINGSQLYNLQRQIAGVSNNWTISDGTNTDRMNSGETITYRAGSNNLKTTVSNNQVTFDIGDNLDVKGTIAAGGPITIKGSTVSLSGTGLNNGGNKVTNVADGTIAANSKDAVNGGQLHTVKQVVDTVAGKVASGFDVTGNNGEKINVQLGSNLNVKGTDGNIVSTTENGQIGLKLADDLKVGNSINVGGDTGVTINATGIDMKGHTINNVGKGEISATSTQAINGSQLYEFKTDVTQKLDNAVQYDGADKTSVTLGGKNATTTVKLTNVAPAELSATSTDAVNGSQLYTTNTRVDVISKELDKGYNYAADTGTTSNLKLGSTVNVKGAKDGSIKTHIDGNTITVGLTDDVNIKGNTTIGGDVIMNGGKITGVGPGDISSTSTDVINGSQLYEVKTDVKNIGDKLNKGWDLVDGKGNKTNVQMGTGLVTKNTDGNLDITVSDGVVTTNLSKDITLDGATIGGTTLNSTSVNLNGKPIEGLAPGKVGTDAVNVNQLNSGLNQVNQRIDKVADEAKAGTAAAIAVGSLGQAWEYGRNTISVAGSAYDGKAGWAVGGSHITDNGKWMVKYNASGSDSKKVGFGASATYQY